MSGPEQAGAGTETAGKATDAGTDPALAATDAVGETAGKATDAVSETAGKATDAVSETAGKATGTKPTPADAARDFLQEALEPPEAIEDVAAFTPRPGSPAAEPAVQAARAEAEAARAALGLEIAHLKDRGREAIDVKAKVKGMPAAIAKDPRKFIGIGTAGAGIGLALRSMRGSRRKAMPPGLLPPQVEAALQGVGPDAEKVREALDASFTSYLEASGAVAPSRRRRVKGLVPLFILPVASTATREAIKRLMAGPPKR